MALATAATIESALCSSARLRAGGAVSSHGVARLQRASDLQVGRPWRVRGRSLWRPQAQMNAVTRKHARARLRENTRLPDSSSRLSGPIETKRIETKRKHLRRIRRRCSLAEEAHRFLFELPNEWSAEDRNQWQAIDFWLVRVEGQTKISEHSVL